MDQDEVWAAVQIERLGLADLLGSLSEAELERPSLCAGWRIRDVAAHLALSTAVGPGRALVEIVRARGSLNRMIHDTAVRHAATPFDEIVEQIRASATSRVRAPGTKPLDPLFDALVHGQDIAQPLGLKREMPVEVAVAMTTYIWERGLPGYSPRRRLHGLRFVATDTEWSIGEGAVVEGPMQSLLLILSGRPAALPYLTGAGTAEVGSRMP